LALILSLSWWLAVSMATAMALEAQRQMQEMMQQQMQDLPKGFSPPRTRDGHRRGCQGKPRHLRAIRVSFVFFVVSHLRPLRGIRVSFVPFVLPGYKHPPNL
jgi:hypothetical protein